MARLSAASACGCAGKRMQRWWAGPLWLPGKAAKQAANVLELSGKLASNGQPFRHFFCHSMKFQLFQTLRVFAFPAAALLLTMGAQAQSADLPATAAMPSSSAATGQTPAPRYGASDLQQAFDFMDANRDGKISREEAAGFRGVARYFDQADTDKDGFLSRSEFDAAMNYVKPK